MTSVQRGQHSTRSNQGSQGTQGVCSGSLAGSDIPFASGEDFISVNEPQITAQENLLRVQESVIDDGTMVASSVIEENKSEDQIE